MKKFAAILSFIFCACGSETESKDLSMNDCHLPVKGDFYIYTVKSDDCGFEETSSVIIDEFMEDVPMSIRLAKFRSRTGKKSDVRKGKIRSEERRVGKEC